MWRHPKEAVRFIMLYVVLIVLLMEHSVLDLHVILSRTSLHDDLPWWYREVGIRLLSCNLLELNTFFNILKHDQLPNCQYFPRISVSRPSFFLNPIFVHRYFQVLVRLEKINTNYLLKFYGRLIYILIHTYMSRILMAKN